MATKKKSVKKAAKKSVKKKAVKAECPTCASWNAKTRKLSPCDISMIKLASMAFILFLITVWSGAMNFVQSIHWGWWLALTILFSLRPFAKFWS